MLKFRLMIQWIVCFTENLMADALKRMVNDYREDAVPYKIPYLDMYIFNTRLL